MPKQEIIPSGGTHFSRGSSSTVLLDAVFGVSIYLWFDSKLASLPGHWTVHSEPPL